MNGGSISRAALSLVAVQMGQAVRAVGLGIPTQVDGFRFNLAQVSQGRGRNDRGNGQSFNYYDEAFDYDAMLQDTVGDMWGFEEEEPDVATTSSQAKAQSWMGQSDDESNFSFAVMQDPEHEIPGVSSAAKGVGISEAQTEQMYVIDTVAENADKNNGFAEWSPYNILSDNFLGFGNMFELFGNNGKGQMNGPMNDPLWHVFNFDHHK